MSEVIEKELILVENNIVIENHPAVAHGRTITNKIFNKLKEIIDFPEGVQEINISLSVDAFPVIDIKHLIIETREIINTILTIK